MTEQSPGVDHQSGTERAAPPGIPRWVKISAVAVGVLILLFLILQLTGIAGEHGPGRHASGSAPQSAGLDGWTTAVSRVA